MIVIPDRMKKFPLFRGIYPIHYTVFVNPDGTPDFKVMHEFKRIEAFNKNLCHLCGERMMDGLFAFIGGPNCMNAHKFIDGPMHLECAQFAAKICPFLRNAAAHYSKQTGHPAARPDKMYLCTASSYSTQQNRGDRRYTSGVQANLPDSPGQIICIAGEWISVTEIETDN